MKETQVSSNIRQEIKHLKLNWHFTNLCNMRCAFCYAAKNSTKPNLFAIADKLKDFTFINLVGGEPTLHKDYSALVKYLATNHKVSVVSNGTKFLLNNDIFTTTLQHCETIGISIDSVCTKTNMLLGRSYGSKRAISENEYLWLCKRIKESGKRLKINTVVNSFNVDEDMNDFIEKAKPDVWKIFQVLPIEGYNTKAICITDSEFKSFIQRHKRHSHIMQIEDNHCMTNSYIMLDSLGRFFNNIGGKYTYSQSVLDNGICVMDIFRSMNYDIQAYNNRYLIGAQNLYSTDSV